MSSERERGQRNQASGLPAGGGEGSRRRQKRGEETRLRILEAVLALLATGGSGAVSHRAVAARAGVSLGATTYYFANKREMLAAAFELHLTRTRELAEAMLSEGAEASSAALADPEALAEGLRRVLEARVSVGREQYLASTEVVLERARDPDLRERLAAASAASDALAVRMLGELGTSRPEEDAYLLIAVLQGLTLRWLSEGRESDLAERLPGLMRRLAEMLSPPAA